MREGIPPVLRLVMAAILVNPLNYRTDHKSLIAKIRHKVPHDSFWWMDSTTGLSTVRNTERCEIVVEADKEIGGSKKKL
jgi:hypothetical protein